MRNICSIVLDMNSTNLKPVATVDVREYMRAVCRRIAEYEARYEISTEPMRDMVRSGIQRETAEIAKWLQDASIVAHLEELTRARSTAGSGSTRTRRFTKAP